MLPELVTAGVILGCLLVVAACSVLVGRAVPLVSLVGLDVIAALLVPSYLVHGGWFDAAALAAVNRGFGALHVLDWFITVIIVGSLVSLDMRHIARLSTRMVVPLLAGSMLAAGAATLAGMVFGFSAHHALFYLAVPVMAGGLTAGAIPLASGYASITGISQGSALALLLPPVVIGNIVAAACAGLNRAGVPQRSVHGLAVPAAVASVPWIAMALALLAVLRWVSQVVATGLDMPSVLVLMALVLVLQLGGVFVGPLKEALAAVYRWCMRWLTFPILTLVGLLLLSWEMIISGLAVANLLTIAVVVVVLVATGRVAAPRLGMDRGEAATIMLARAAMGGTGNIAILRAAQRLGLMPIAQLATRLGGAATVAAALAAMTLLGR